jgi:B12 binding domain
MPPTRKPPPSPILLLGAGLGEATCGILYLAGYLRRHGVESYVRLTDTDETDTKLHRSLKHLIAHVRPKLIGISLKWFHHLGRAKRMAESIRRIDPDIHITLGGNSATFWCNELLTWPCIDSVILGDGEAPLLALCQGIESPPNVVFRTQHGPPSSTALTYVQGRTSADIHYSHFNDIFLSQLDRHSFSGWVAPGKGCSENCLYCSGTRGLQKATFGRAKPFLRPIDSVQKDHREIAPHTWQLRYDFAGSTAAFLQETWGGVDFSKHATTYFLWGVPPPELAKTLSNTFQCIYMVLDIGCFSETQRLEQMRRGLLKPCPTDAQLFKVIEDCQRHANIQLEISGIAGLPFSNHLALKQEQRLVKRIIQAGCSIGYQRLECQPGALVTEHPKRFGMTSEASTFSEFLQFFENQEPGDVSVPMIRYADDAFEREVQNTADEVDALVWQAADKKRAVALNAHTPLVNASAATASFTWRDWFGAYQTPSRLADEQVMVIRSADGHGLTCAPSVRLQKNVEPSVYQGDDAKLLLDLLQGFHQPKPMRQVLAQLPPQQADHGREAVEHLVSGGFLQPSRK